LLGRCKVISLLIFVNDSSRFHYSFVVAAILLFVLKLIIFVAETHEFLVKLKVFKAGAFDERLAAVVDDHDFLGVIVHVHVVNGSVGVDNVRLNVELALVEPFFLEVEVATAVDEHETGNGLERTSQKIGRDLPQTWTVWRRSLGVDVYLKRLELLRSELHLAAK
jgi:hypothetical protein